MKTTNLLIGAVLAGLNPFMSDILLNRDDKNNYIDKSTKDSTGIAITKAEEKRKRKQQKRLKIHWILR